MKAKFVGINDPEEACMSAEQVAAFYKSSKPKLSFWMTNSDIVGCDRDHPSMMLFDLVEHAQKFAVALVASFLPLKPGMPVTKYVHFTQKRTGIRSGNVELKIQFLTASRKATNAAAPVPKLVLSREDASDLKNQIESEMA